MDPVGKRYDDDFIKLRNEWYKILEETGFKEIEDIHSKHEFMKEWDFNFFRTTFNEIKYECTFEYYHRARALLHTYEFEQESHRKIWELHSEGATERQITKRLKKYKKSMVHYIIDKISRMIKKD